jgi:cytochrome c-type biogenesis protein CcmH/NrfG
MSKAVTANETRTTWSAPHAYIFGVVCLVMGIALGYLFRGSSSNASPTAHEGPPVPVAQSAAGTQPTPQQFKQMADKQAEPLIAQLKSQPNDAELLARIGNIYYDVQQYKEAVNYYQQSLKINPKNVDVRTDLGSCFWYSNDPDAALREFDESLKYNPKHAGTLFNMGVVKWQAKMDPDGAVRAWQKLLDTNPGFKEKAKVLDLITRAKQHATLGAPAKKG